MTQLSIPLFLTLALSLAVWGRSECAPIERNKIISELKANLFSCKEKLVGECSYTECLGQIADYPQPILVTVPQEVLSLRLHFHGHHLKMAETLPYEQGLSSMTKAFGIQGSLCQSSELTVFPGSTGKNETYKNYFEPIDPATGRPIKGEFYQKFFTHLHTVLGNHVKEAPLHLSGHSGGGKYVGGALQAGIKTSKVSLFDGIYSDVTKKTLVDWQLKTSGELMSVTVKGMSPDNYTSAIRGELGIGSEVKPKSETISGINYQVYKMGAFTHYSRNTGAVSGLQAHFDVVSNLWPFSTQSR
jgi:hypothetical protein